MIDCGGIALRHTCEPWLRKRRRLDMDGEFGAANPAWTEARDPVLT